MAERVHEAALICPQCSARFGDGARFCPECRLPLVLESGDERAEYETERHRQLRKVKPQLSEGELVKVAWARNQSEAEFIQGLLLEEGVPSMLRRSAGFDVPDFLAAGPRDVMVPISGAQTAREVLLQADVIGPDPAVRAVDPGRLLLGLLAALAIGALLVWLLSLAIH
ncbi:MAG TPA: hypothetical protein VE571_00395 [Solirubrobacteraceae bacterium]|jgi:uncharacterized protein YbaR (Trm112 family)|nr:hypothetical protein [Solirubrobacteraceae bacterium]